nr:MAG: hypothetical protein [Microviridae sp.]
MKSLKQIKKWIEINMKSNTTKQSEKNQHKPPYGENEIIQGTPLWLTKGNEDGTLWFITFANYKLKEMRTKTELMAYYEANKFNLIMDIMMISMELWEQRKKEK